MARRKLPTNMKKQNLTPIWIILAIVVVVVGLLYRGGAPAVAGVLPRAPSGRHFAGRHGRGIQLPV